MPICSECQIEQPEISFPYRNKSKNKRNRRCSVCITKYQREWYRRPGNAKRVMRSNDASDKVREAKTKNAINTLKSSIGCYCCGETDYSCLDFHHTSKKEFNIADMVNRGFALDKILKEVDKCSILCSNCHRKLHAGRTMIHSGISSPARISALQVEEIGAAPICQTINNPLPPLV